MQRLLFLLVMGSAGISLWACTPAATVKVAGRPTEKPQPLLQPQLGESDFGQFVTHHVSEVAPLEKQMNLAYWDASLTGKKEDYAQKSELELVLKKAYADEDKYRTLQRWRGEGTVSDPQQARQLDLLFLAFQENQQDPALLKQMIDLSTEVEEMFNTYRSQVDGQVLTDNDVMDILKVESRSSQRKKVWEAFQARGERVRPKILELVRLRNQAARKLGYADYYEMQLRLMEQDPRQIQALFEDLARQTDQPFQRIMAPVNKKLAARFRIKPADLRPWHYEDPFFQEAPTVGQVDLDPLFRNRDAKAIVEGYFKGVGLNPADILQHSDLYEKGGKMPHAYCIDIDRLGDVRILANLRDNEKWVSTLLHEMGHALYDKYIDPRLPWLLREPAHSFTTEAVAMLFGRQTRNPGWLLRALDLPANRVQAISDDVRFQQRLSMLVFARWGMVMQRFEQELYRNPDQNLDQLWWTLKERYQLQHAPEGRQAADWAAKIHIALWPAYYHNYLLGELMASQLQHHIGFTILKAANWKDLALVDQPAIGEFLRDKILLPGKRLSWSKLLEQATFESLNPAYFAQQFVD